MPLTEEKKKLRSVLRDRRRSIIDTAEKDRAIAERLFTLPAYQNAHQVLLYLSTTEEIGTERIRARAQQDGKAVFAPYCPPNRRAMQFYRILPDTILRRSAFGIDEPDPNSCASFREEDCAGGTICIVPGLAFTADGFRLGYGGGYYDRFLAAHEMETVGLCYEACLLADLPIDAWDRRVDQVITEERWIGSENQKMKG